MTSLSFVIRHPFFMSQSPSNAINDDEIAITINNQHAVLEEEKESPHNTSSFASIID
jgi:hypothetical protein